jgi:hypothetical protein
MPDSRFEIPGFSQRVAARRPLAAIWLAATLASSGCLFQKTPPPRAFRPPPVIPRPAQQVLVPLLDPPPDLDASLTQGSGPVLVPLIASIDAPLPAPPRAVPPARRPPVANTTPAPARAAQPDQPAPPRITRILTPQELNDNTRAYNDSMARVERALNDLAKKNLTVADRDTVDQIRSFETQAKQARDQDLVTAVNLAKRADVLANDLLGRLR